MEAQAADRERDRERERGTNGNSRRSRMPWSAAQVIRSPISALLEYSGLLRPRERERDREALEAHSLLESSSINPNNNANSSGEVSIRIIGNTEQEQNNIADISSTLPPCPDADNRIQQTYSNNATAEATTAVDTHTANTEAENAEANNRDATYQRYDIQQAARWMEQVLPFSLLLLVVFIRQHLQGTTQWH